MRHKTATGNIGGFAEISQVNQLQHAPSLGGPLIKHQSTRFHGGTNVKMDKKLDDRYLKMMTKRQATIKGGGGDNRQWSSLHEKIKGGHDFHKNSDNKKNEIIQERILRQTDKSFVLCIDPETKLPFMVNMGLKTADICDLDNRPQDSKAEYMEDISSSRLSMDSQDIGWSDYQQVKKAILNPRNYPFY